MKKMILAAITAALAVSFVPAVYAEDVVVRTSVGSGEVVFTETSEPASISAEELTALVRSSVKAAAESDVLGLFVDASGDITIKLDETNGMPLKGGFIGDFRKSGDNASASFHYSYDALGSSESANVQAYDWEANDEHFSAVSKDEGEWKVSRSEMFSDMFDSIDDVVDEKAGDFVLQGLQPNLYEEDGRKYYVCKYDISTLLSMANSVEAAQMYTGLADSILSGIPMDIIFVFNAETGFPRAFTINASGAEGSIPGELLGSSTDFGFSCGELYATVLFDHDNVAIEIPEEVLSAEVTDALGELEGLAGGLLGSLDNAA